MYEILTYPCSFQLVPAICLTFLVRIIHPHGQMFSICKDDSVFSAVVYLTTPGLSQLAFLYAIDFAAPHEKKKANIYPRTFYAPKHLPDISTKFQNEGICYIT